MRIAYLDGKVEERALPLGNYDVGRQARHIRFAGDRNVSRLHARLELLPGVVRFVDLDSTCGTFTDDGERVTGVHLLRVGETLAMGNSALTLLKLPAVGKSRSGFSASAVTQQELVAISPDEWEEG